jgi:Asp-tRNA(Asn)/Glu-tRNA(Gln) amidotransferase A subunit family amidase
LEEALRVVSETAGSVRVPAAFCGTYSFNPSRKKIPVKGRINPFLSDIDAFKESPRQ